MITNSLLNVNVFLVFRIWIIFAYAPHLHHHRPGKHNKTLTISKPFVNRYGGLRVKTFCIFNSSFVPSLPLFPLCNCTEFLLSSTPGCISFRSLSSALLRSIAPLWDSDVNVCRIEWVDSINCRRIRGCLNDAWIRSELQILVRTWTGGEAVLRDDSETHLWERVKGEWVCVCLCMWTGPNTISV